MALAATGLLHGRYVRLSDKFKALWTYHQFATGVFDSLLRMPLPFAIDFQRLYETLKSASKTIHSDDPASASELLDRSESELDRVMHEILSADDLVAPPIVRRFFERLKQQDERILSFLIKFYLYAGAVTGDRRDKLDFLFTRLGEDFVESRGEYCTRDSLELRQQMFAIAGVRHSDTGTYAEIVKLIRVIRGMRDEIRQTDTFDRFSERSLLRNARAFKHRIGDLYFHPDVLLAVIDLNVATKNRFLELYREEEPRIATDAAKLSEYEQALAFSFGDSNPELIEEIARFRGFKQRFDESRASSNVKHDDLSRLKASISNILVQLDRGLGTSGEDSLELPDTFFEQAQRSDTIAGRFGDDPVLHPFLIRIAALLDSAGTALAPDRIAGSAQASGLRLEPWEVAAYQKLYGLSERAEEETDDLLELYVRAAALRIKIDEEATQLASIDVSSASDPVLTSRIRDSLDRAKELDALFGDCLHDEAYHASPRILHQLFRSRFRLLRGFTGLWLIWDARSAHKG